MNQALEFLSDNPWALWLALGVLALISSKQSQFDEWANSHPRVAGVMKLLRGLGLDPFLLLQSLSLIIRGRLPEQSEPKAKKPPTLPLITIALVCLGLSGCASWKPAARTVNDVARDLCSIFFAEKQGISIEQAAEAACDTRDKLDPWIREVLAAQQTAGAAASK